MQVIREQLNANEEILWERTYPTENLLVGKRCDYFFAICFIWIGIASVVFLISWMVVYHFVPSGLMWVFSITLIIVGLWFYVVIRRETASMELIQSWYGEAGLRQYKKLTVISNHHLFIKHPSIVKRFKSSIQLTSEISRVSRIVNVTKDIMVLDITALSSISYEKTNEAFINFNLAFVDPAQKQSSRARVFTFRTRIDVPTQARDEVIRILRQIKPLVAITSYAIPWAPI